jgi:hypothetical protein
VKLIKLVMPRIMNYMTAKIVGTYKVRIVMVTTNQIQGSDDSSSAGSYESSLSLKSMAGIFLLHLCFSVIAIIIGLFSYLQEKGKADQYKRSVSRVTSK